MTLKIWILKIFTALFAESLKPFRISVFVVRKIWTSLWNEIPKKTMAIRWVFELGSKPSQWLICYRWQSRLSSGFICRVFSGGTFLLSSLRALRKYVPRLEPRFGRASLGLRSTSCLFIKNACSLETVYLEKQPELSSGEVCPFYMHYRRSWSIPCKTGGFLGALCSALNSCFCGALPVRFVEFSKYLHA